MSNQNNSEETIETKIRLMYKNVEDLKIKAGQKNYYIKSWFYRNEEFAAEVYRADIYNEDDESTWELCIGSSELDAVQTAFIWMTIQEDILKETGQDYETLHDDTIYEDVGEIEVQINDALMKKAEDRIDDAERVKVKAEEKYRITVNDKKDEAKVQVNVSIKEVAAARVNARNILDKLYGMDAIIEEIVTEVYADDYRDIEQTRMQEITKTLSRLDKEFGNTSFYVLVNISDDHEFVLSKLAYDEMGIKWDNKGTAFNEKRGDPELIRAAIALGDKISMVPGTMSLESLSFEHVAAGYILNSEGDCGAESVEWAGDCDYNKIYHIF